MPRITHRERYINALLKMNANITQMIRTEIGEIFHDRGRSPEEMEYDLENEIKCAFSNGMAYKCKKREGGGELMTIDEAICHAEEKAEINQAIADNTDHDNWMDIVQCEKCATEHRQLAEWLKELKHIREKYEHHYDHTDCIWHNSIKNGNCPSTCAQYRDGWNDAMEYIYKNGKGYAPFARRGDGKG